MAKLYYAILFTEDGAYYHGNNSGNNTLKVNTIKGKAAKGVAGEAVAVSLADSTDPAATNELYVNIQTVDASASANEVALTAAAVSEYGTKFLKAHAGVDVTAAAGGNATLTVRHGDTVKATATANTGYKSPTLKEPIFNGKTT